MNPRFVCEETVTEKMLANRIRSNYGTRYAVLLAVAAIYFLYVLFMVIEEGVDIFWLGMLFLSVVLLGNFAFGPEIRARKELRQYKRDTASVGIYRIAFGDTIEIFQGDIRVTWDYGQINRVRHLKYTYELIKSERLAIMVDPNGFTKGTFAEFKEFLREKRPDLQIPE